MTNGGRRIFARPRRGWFGGGGLEGESGAVLLLGR